MRTLDIGCGSYCRGDVGVDITFDPPACGHEPTHLDIYSAPRNPLAELGKLDLNWDNPLSDIFRIGEFDILYAVHVLEHLRQPLDVLTDAWAVMAGGGTLIWICPNARLNDADRHDPQHIYSWTEWSARRLVEAAGFAVTDSLLICGAQDIRIVGVKQ